MEEEIKNVCESVSIMRFEPNDILLVKVNTQFTNELANAFKSSLDQVIPKDLNIKVLFMGDGVEFVIMRKDRDASVN